MDYYNSIIKLRDLRETNDSYRFRYQRRLHATSELVTRLGLEAELEGHGGCVNCLEWNHKGDLLASGSDDLHIMIWDPFRQKRLQDIPTGHNGNLFSVKFLMNDSRVISGAADYRIRMHDINTKDLTLACHCHGGRVKRLAVAPSVPFMFWSCAEDGVIMQYDVRAPHECSNVCSNALINLVYHLGRNAEGKCIAINPLRPELLAVGANDPYVRLYDRRMIKPTIARYPRQPNNSISWDGSSYANELVEPGEDNIPPGAVSYFVAGKLGHLPLKQDDFKKRYRTLTSTYLAFSPDGNELLANLGGEQIYLFNIVNKRKQLVLNVLDFLQPLEHSSSEDGVISKKENPPVIDGKTCNAITLSLYEQDTSPYVWSSPHERAKYEAIRTLAHNALDEDQFTIAISLYTKALLRYPKIASLYSNRASAFIRRGWDGDYYEAIRDCYYALKLLPNYLNAHYRLCVAFLELDWLKEALDCMTAIRSKFPDQTKTRKFEALEADIKVACFDDIEPAGSGSEDESGSSSGNKRRSNSVNKALLAISDQEKEWRASAYDYETRYCGHCNTTTDIKEANFFGSNGQYIVAGSDDGSLFMWDRTTSTIIKVLRGDESIVNCLQPHPSTCLLATSGIDPVVRLWVPQAEDGKKENREIRNSEDAAVANQRRMNADPLEIMLINMGYRIPGLENMSEDLEQRIHPERSTVQCRTS